MTMVFSPESTSKAIKLWSGELALDGSNPTPLALAPAPKRVDSVTVALKGSSTPGDSTSVLTYDVVSNTDGTKTVNVYAWKNTGGTDPTLAASTGTETLSYQVVGA